MVHSWSIHSPFIVHFYAVMDRSYHTALAGEDLSVFARLLKLICLCSSVIVRGSEGISLLTQSGSCLEDTSERKLR